LLFKRDGKSVTTFIGETTGTLASKARGRREFYWDTIFQPDDPRKQAVGKTYAEIVEDSNLGLQYKVLNLSQSTIAMLKFLEHVRRVGRPTLWE
jgi:inosine/xanthosine triphosphate pyrophosphatase family protein